MSKAKKYMELVVAEDYGTSEGAVKAAETRRLHGGMSPLQMRYMLQKIGKEFGGGAMPEGAGIPFDKPVAESGRHQGQPHGFREAFFNGKADAINEYNRRKVGA